MFVFKNAVGKTNLKVLEDILLENEEITCFEQVGVEFIAHTSRGRVFIKKYEDTLTSQLYVFNDTSITGIAIYKKQAAIIKPVGFSLVIGSKEITIYSGDEDQIKKVYKVFQRIIWGR